MKNPNETVSVTLKAAEVDALYCAISLYSHRHYNDCIKNGDSVEDASEELAYFKAITHKLRAAIQ